MVIGWVVGGFFLLAAIKVPSFSGAPSNVCEVSETILALLGAGAVAGGYWWQHWPAPLLTP